MQQSGRRGNNWIGLLIFIFFVFGSRFLPPLATWLSQVTGLPITPPLLIAAVIGLAVVGSIAGGVIRQAGRARSSNETRLPTPPPLALPTDTTAQRGQPTRPSAPPPAVRLPPATTRLPSPRLPSGEQRLPGPPRFEPIIGPRVLAFGIIGLLALGAFLLGALFLTGALP